ncbi:Disintegrin and metalloproteinase domain-containing protein 33, partial [Ophiophagus hannah]
MAHEIGHNFGMSHDAEGCCMEATASQGGCVMAAATGGVSFRIVLGSLEGCGCLKTSGEEAPTVSGGKQFHWLSLSRKFLLNSRLLLSLIHFHPLLLVLLSGALENKLTPSSLGQPLR